MPVQMLGIKTKFTDDQGRPLIGGTVHTYFAGTSLPQDTFSDPELTVPNTNPVKLDDTGSADIFLKGVYRVRVFDRRGKFVEEQDNVSQLATVSDVAKNKGGLNTANERIDKAYDYIKAMNTDVSELKQKTITLESVAELSTIKNPKDGVRVYVKSFYNGGKKGGGWFRYDALTKKSDADGCQIVDTDNTGRFDGSSDALEQYLVIQGSGLGEGCWIKDNAEYLCPYDFGYNNDYLTGLLSIYAIICYAKKQGYGHLKIPEGQDFYLGSNKKNPNNYTPAIYEVGDNFAWLIPETSRVLINGHVPLWHQPTGYGYDGGTKNFKLYGGGSIEGVSLKPEDYCFFSMNFIHTAGIKCYDISFINAANGHVFDLMGCKDIHIKGCKFIGSTMDFKSARNGNEVIQIGGVTSGGRATAVDKYNQYMDYLQCSNITIEDCEFKAYRDTETGAIITHTQKAVGDHVFYFDTIDRLVLKNLYIEQSDPDAVNSKQNYTMLVIPPVSELIIDNVCLKIFAGGNTKGGLSVISNTTYKQITNKPSVATELPQARTVTRAQTSKVHQITNLTIDTTDVLDISYFRAIATKCSTTIDNFKYIGKLSAGSQFGADIFTLMRSGDTVNVGGEGSEEHPVITVKNSEIEQAKNIVFAPEAGYLCFDNVRVDGGQLAFRGPNSKYPRQLKLDKFTQIGTDKGRKLSNYISADNIQIVNCTFLDLIDSDETIKTETPDASGFCVNSTFYGGEVLTAWQSGAGSMLLASNTELKNAT